MANAPPNDVETDSSWTDEVIRLVGELRGGTVAKLMTLAASPPQGANAFPALREVLRLLGVSTTHPTPSIPASERSEVDATRQISAAGVAAVALVRGCVRTVDEALDAGLNDPVDMIIRPIDFGEGDGSGRIGVMTATIPPFALSVQVGIVDRLPPDHPLKALEAVPFREWRVLVLGRTASPTYRLSEIRAMTRTAQEWERERLAAGRARIERMNQAPARL